VGHEVSQKSCCQLFCGYNVSWAERHWSGATGAAVFYVL